MSSRRVPTRRTGRSGTTSSRRRSITIVALAAVALSACLPVKQFSASGRPNNAQDPDFSWYLAPAAQPQKQVMIGLTRAGPPDPARPAILLIHGSDGLNRDYMALAREFRAANFDVAIGCWAYAGKPATVVDPLIQCPLGPTPPGISEPAVAELGQLVAATRQALATSPASLTVVGFSRGSGVALLGNSLGRTEPTVSISGMLTGTSAWGNLPGEVDVTARAATFAAPTLLIHGEADGLTPIAQAHAMADALTTAGKVIAAKYYPGVGHGLLTIPSVRADAILTIVSWARDPLAPLPDPGGGVTNLDDATVDAVRQAAEKHGILPSLDGL